jgi:hypothetical protein
VPRIRINGVQHDIAADQDMPPLWAIRDIAGLIGTKFGCGVDSSGAPPAGGSRVADRPQGAESGQIDLQ